MRLAISLVVIAFCVWSPQGPAIANESGSVATRTWYAVEIRIGPNWDTAVSPYEQAYFSEHSAYLKELRSAGHIVVGARYSDVGLLVFSAHSAEEISALMDKDPSVQAGTFSYEIYPMNVFYSGFLGNKR